MFRSRPRERLVAAMTAVSLLAVGCGGVSSPVADGSGRWSPATVRPGNPTAGQVTTGTPVDVATAGVTPIPSEARLIALADGEDGQRRLWSLGSDSRWNMVSVTPGATALGRTPDGIAVASTAGLEARSRVDLSKPAGVALFRWSGRTPATPIVDVDYSSAGSLAVVASDATGAIYAVARPKGSLQTLFPAPVQSFTPTVRWLDENRILVLSTDVRQVSRLAVVETAGHTLTATPALSGVRVFGVSLDRRVVAAATESAIYVAPVAALGEASAPAPAVALAAEQVVWAMAMDESGSRLFVLSGIVAPNGSVGTVHELAFALDGAVWKKLLDAPVPFGRAISQAYLP